MDWVRYLLQDAKHLCRTAGANSKHPGPFLGAAKRYPDLRWASGTLRNTSVRKMARIILRALKLCHSLTVGLHPRI